MNNISKLNFIFIFNLIILIFAFNALAIDRNIPKTNEEWDKAWASLNWKKGPSVVNYNQANSKINIPSNFDILEGKEAHQVLYWINGVDFDYIDVYAMGQNSEQYMFDYTDSGYVKTDDWTDVDPDKFLKELIENYYPFLFWSRDKSKGFFDRISKTSLFEGWRVHPNKIALTKKKNVQYIMYCGQGKGNPKLYIDQLIFKETFLSNPSSSVPFV